MLTVQRARILFAAGIACVLSFGAARAFASETAPAAVRKGWCDPFECRAECGPGCGGICAGLDCYCDC
ncbi:MAG TPA: hypothetical protein VF771_05740 [Longimicrobiaceae bacterium]